MKEFIKFFGVGGISTLVDYSIYLVLLYFNTEYTLAIIMAYGSGFYVNYFLGRRYVFNKGVKKESNHYEFFAVFSIAFVGLLLNIAIVHVLSVCCFNLALEYSRLIAIILVFIYNYTARKVFVYH